MSPTDLNEPFAPKDVCRTLIRQKLLTKDQAKQVLVRREKVTLELEEESQKRSASFGLKISNPVTFVDVVARLRPPRADGKPGGLEEDAIFQALAKEWDLPYQKIDPLKLDLNIVTTTIIVPAPRTNAQPPSNIRCQMLRRLGTL